MSFVDPAVRDRSGLNQVEWEGSPLSWIGRNAKQPGKAVAFLYFRPAKNWCCVVRPERGGPRNPV